MKVRGRWTDRGRAPIRTHTRAHIHTHVLLSCPSHSAVSPIDSVVIALNGVVNNETVIDVNVTKGTGQEDAKSWGYCAGKLSRNLPHLRALFLARCAPISLLCPFVRVCSLFSPQRCRWAGARQRELNLETANSEKHQKNIELCVRT